MLIGKPARNIISRLLIPVMLALLFVQWGSAGVIAASYTPDLIVKSISFSPENPTLRDKLTITAVIHNAGNERAASSKIECYIDGERINSTYTDSIVPGADYVLTFQWKTRAGDHTIRVVVDGEKTVAESDESNNESTLAFSVLAPNLLIREISWLPEHPSVQDNVTITVVTTNEGNAGASNSNLEFYIDNASRGYIEIPRLDAGKSTINTFKWLAQPGTHEFKAVADVLNQVVEGNEADNTEVVTCATLAPDLIVSDINWTPVSPVESDNVTFTVTIKNQGDGRAVYSRVAYMIDGGFVGTAPVPALAAGASVNQTFSWIAAAGLHTVGAIADSGGENIESNENNNQKTKSLAQATADLVVQSITWVPSRPVAGQDVTCNVTLLNQGYGICGVSSLDFLVGTSHYSATIQAIRGGGTAWTVFSWVAQEGQSTLTAAADVENNIEETDETNNTLTVSMTPDNRLPPPDLVVKSLVWSPEQPAAGDQVTMTAVVKNEGSSPAAGSTFNVYLAGECIFSSVIDNLDAGAYAEVGFTWQARAGTHQLSVLADAGRVINEANEDNALVANIKVLAPDLIVKELWVAPADPVPGKEMTVSATVANRGDYPSATFYLAYYVSGILRGSLYVEALAPGGSAVKTIALATPDGACVLKALADVKGEVPESDENNNEKAVTLPYPDFVIEGLTWQPQELSPGNRVVLSLAVRNRGGDTAQKATVNFYVDNNPLANRVLDLPQAGDSVNITLEWIAQPGLHIARFVIDEPDAVSESREDNNVKSIEIKVAAPPSTPVPPATPPPVTANPAPPVSPPASIQPVVPPIPAAPEKGATTAKSLPAAKSPAKANPWYQRWLVSGLISAVIITAVTVWMLFRNRKAKNSQTAARPQGAVS
ncbi:MAG: CARDB domain-containing protein [Dehalococcoidales bacterium]|nr:CARDB domain-containing protein [Dehalococcoidales bacterium]